MRPAVVPAPRARARPSSLASGSTNYSMVPAALRLLVPCCTPLLLLMLYPTSAYARVLSLAGSTKAPEGSPWILHNHNGSLSLPATVPGVVHLDLLRAGRIAEPYYRYGELDLAWVYLEQSWTFSRTIPAGVLGATPGRVLLRSEGLDTVATVTLNGHLIAHTSNMFHRHLWDVTSAFLPSAANTLKIRFDSPALASTHARQNYPYPVSGSYITPLQYPSCNCPDPAACFGPKAKGCDCLVKCKHRGHYQTTRNFLRKSQAHWGWDWGAGFLTSGIYRDLSLLSYEHSAVIRDVVVQVFPTSPKPAPAPGENPTSVVHPAPRNFRVDLDVFLISDTQHNAIITAAIPSLGVANSTMVTVAPGEQKVRLTLQLSGVPKEALWYPNGYGEAVLHDMNVTVQAAAHSGQVPDASKQWVKRIGLKSVELVQEPLPPGLPCGRPNCGGGPTCSDRSTGGGYTCAFQKASGKCNQSLAPWHVPLGYCCATCFNCSTECLSVNDEKLQPGGLSMVFRVNGKPVFIKGANWIATDQFEPRIPQRKQAKSRGGGDYHSAGAGFDALLGAAKAAHYNMLRVRATRTVEITTFIH
jgi:hypothetical protein